MDEAPVNRGYLHEHRKTIAVVILLILIPGITVYTIGIMLDNNAEPEPYDEISHLLTVWIAPEDDEFELRLDFYGSEQDASSEANRYSYLIFSVVPASDEEHRFGLFKLPKTLPSVWVKMRFGSSTEEPSVTIRADMGTKTSTQLLGRGISIILEPWQGS